MKYKLKLNYTVDELKELKNNLVFCDSPMKAVVFIVERKAGIKALAEKYDCLCAEDEFDFMADVNNVLMGTAVFPKNKNFIVHDVLTGSYLREDISDKKLYWSVMSINLPAERTKQEWLEINPAYESMLEEVE